MWRQNPKLIESSLLHEAIRKVLNAHGRLELLSEIQSIKHHEWRVTLATQKPIINAELTQYSSEFSSSIYQVLHDFLPEVKEFIIQFR